MTTSTINTSPGKTSETENLPVYGGTPEVSQGQEQVSAQAKDLPKPIAGVLDWAREKIGNLLVPQKTSSPGIVERVMKTVEGWKSTIMNIFSDKDIDKKGKITPTSITTALPETSSSISSLPKEVQKAYEDAENYHRRKMEIMENSFANLSRDVSPGKVLSRDPTGTSDPENLNNLASQRIKNMKTAGNLAHDDAFLKQHGCAESISRVSATSGKDIAQDFMNSVKEGNFPHRRNMLGSYKRFGVKMYGPIFDPTTKEYFYYVVALYKDGETIPEKDKEGKPTKIDPVVIPEDTGPRIADDVVRKYFDALNLQIKSTGSTIRHLDNIEANAAMSAEGKAQGSFQVTFTDDSGKRVNYLVSRNPPRLTREVKDGEYISVLFEDVLADFAKAPDVKSKPKAPQPSTPSEKPTAENLPTAAELKKQFAMESYQKEENPAEAVINPS